MNLYLYIALYKHQILTKAIASTNHLKSNRVNNGKRVVKGYQVIKINNENNKYLSRLDNLLKLLIHK